MAAGVVQSTNGDSETVFRSPEVKVCQTETLILLSIMEACLTEADVNVSIERENLSVEIARDKVANPILAGKLFGAVETGHCRVRIKDDCVVIKLRKSEDGRWKSILHGNSKLMKAKVNPETRVRPMKTPLSEIREPIEPREEPKYAPRLNTIANEARGEQKGNQVEEAAIQPSESMVMGVIENMRRFHQSLLGSTSLESQPTKDDDDIDIEGPLVKRPDPK